VKSTLAASAIPIGMPGWPDFARSTASIDRARIAFAMRANSGSSNGTAAPPDFAVEVSAAMVVLKADAKEEAAPARARVD
jgi:hypothetical protein